MVRIGVLRARSDVAPHTLDRVSSTKPSLGVRIIVEFLFFLRTFGPGFSRLGWGLWTVVQNPTDARDATESRSTGIRQRLDTLAKTNGT